MVSLSDSGSESSRVRSSNLIRSAGTECRVHLDSVSRCRQALQGRRAERIAAGRVRPTPYRYRTWQGTTSLVGENRGLSRLSRERGAERSAIARAAIVQNTLLWEKKAASAPTQVPTGQFCRGGLQSAWRHCLMVTINNGPERGLLLAPLALLLLYDQD